jgi:E3 ubiquitin-protein ligase TRIP12
LPTASGQNQDQLFFFSATGLFPSPLNVASEKKLTSKQQALCTKIKLKFKFFGKFVAKAIMDFRVLDLQLSQTFYKWLIDERSLCYQDIKYVDTQLYRSLEHLKDILRQRRNLLLNAYKSEATLNGKDVEKQIVQLEKSVADLDLDFTLPGYSTIELKKNGKDILVNLENLEEYLNLIVEWTLIKGVQAQFESFREGFDSILPIACLKQFFPEELERLFCGSGFIVWDAKMLTECTRCDHGYSHESKAVVNLFEIMCSFNSDEQRQFLQFVTGSPRLPVGGLRSLVPPLTIVRKTVDSSNLATSENYLPSVMTCVNYLKLPEYSSLESMRDKLVKAMSDGQLSFHLS